MSDDSRQNRKPPGLGWKMPLLGIVTIGLMIVTTGLVSQRVLEQKAAELRLESEMARAATAEAELRAEIEGLNRAAVQRETEIAARVRELGQREAAIAGREDAATERTQSSFQGLLIQQNLLKNLEALKAGLPDMTPEVERLTREHAQFNAEMQRLRKENDKLRVKRPSSAPLEIQ